MEGGAESSGANLEIRSTERLVPVLGWGRRAPRAFFRALLLCCFLLHAALLALLLDWDRLVQRAAPEEEMPVEVVVLEPPAEKEPEPPKAMEPAPKPELDVKPAFDAPRAPNEETLDREAAEEETKAERVAKPLEHPAPKAEPETTASAQGAENQASSPQEPPLDRTPGEEAAQAASEPKPVTPEQKRAREQTIADQVAALAPVPDFQIGAAARPAPVTGGKARTTYLSILFGLIMRQMHTPAGARLPGGGEGIIVFYLDERGDLTHQALARSSGSPALDSAALGAIRRAAPYPAPPYGHPRALRFHFNAR